MTAGPEPSSPSQIPDGEHTSEERTAHTPDRIDPTKVRVVDVEKKATGEVIRRDCYDPDGGAAEMGDVMRLDKGQLWLRTIDWARSSSPHAELTLTWEPMGLTPEDIGRIGVFTWPLGEPVRVFAEKE